MADSIDHSPDDLPDRLPGESLEDWTARMRDEDAKAHAEEERRITIGNLQAAYDERRAQGIPTHEEIVAEVEYSADPETDASLKAVLADMATRPRRKKKKDETPKDETPKRKEASRPDADGKTYLLERPKDEDCGNSYWAWGGSLRRCLLWLGYQVRYNERSEQVEYLRTKPRRSPAKIEKLARDTEPVEPLSTDWKVMNDDECNRVIEKIERFCRWERFDVNSKGKLVRRYMPVDYTSIRGSSRKSWPQVLMSSVADHRIDPFKWWLLHLPEWDQVPRIDTMLATVFDVKDTRPEIAAAAAWVTLGGSVERTFKPGSEHHQTALITGPTGIGKTKVWSYLIPDSRFFIESLSIGDMRDPKLMIEMIGMSAICEIAEIAAVGGKIDIERLKTLLTNPRLRARLAYRHNPVVHECRHVFVGTSNEVSPLPLDDALARRFIVVEATGRMSKEPRGVFAALDDWAQKNREQVWAEALHRWRSGESTHVPEEIYMMETLSQMHVSDHYEEFLLELEQSPRTEWSAAEMMNHGYWRRVGYDPSMAVIGKAAARRKWTTRYRKEQGTRRRFWSPPPGDKAAKTASETKAQVNEPF